MVAVALANRTARIVWAVMARGEAYRAKEIAGASGLNRPPIPQDCEGEEEVMAKQSSRGSGRPGKFNAPLERAFLIGTRSANSI
ncbi:MAG: hypothetical protein WA238_09150, partial [Methylocella sp.]